MKSIKLIASLLSISFMVACSSDDEVTRQVEIPSQFSINIPTSISSNANLGGRLANDEEGVIKGNEIYESLRGFIQVGEGSAEIIELTLQIASAFEQQSVRSYTFESEDDLREKRIDLMESVTRGGVTYDFEMTMVDTENEDMALQLLWNTSPVNGIGVLSLYHIDRVENAEAKDALIRIDYTEDDANYDATMTVSITGLEAAEDGDIDNLKMFVGKKGDVVDVMGNSNHPDIIIIDENFTGGRNYAFVARGDESTDLGVAKLALPPSATTTADVLVDFSVFAVLEAEIQAAGFTDQDIIDAVLIEAQSPAYFNNDGFITSGADNKPASFSDSFVDLSGMNPFVPNDVKNLTIDFLN